MFEEHKNYIQSMPYAKNAISMIFNIRILDRYALQRKKEKHFHDLPLSISRLGEKKIGFMKMCFVHHLLVDFWRIG